MQLQESAITIPLYDGASILCDECLRARTVKKVYPGSKWSYVVTECFVGLVYA